IGVGGGGGNAVNHMVANNIEGVEFICANTDAQALRDITARTVLQLGTSVTKGLGAGTNPEVGRKAAEEDRERIAEVLQGTDMVFITTGMGGGTGTGAAPIIAQVAKEMGILTVAVVTRPFPFEGKRRLQIADEGIRLLAEHVDSLITIPNEKLLTILGKDASLLSAFAKADDVLAGAVRGISDIIKRPGMINVDFADVKTVMSEMGMAMMGTGCASGPNRAREATEEAIRNPLLDDVNLNGARGILVNITAGPDLSLGEYAEVGSIIEAFASDEAMVKVGTVIDPDMRDELHVTVVATGLDPRMEKPVKVVDNTNTLKVAAAMPAMTVALDEGKEVNYNHYDRPAMQRRASGGAATASKPSNQEEMDYLDIPAFLRRQAD
ncbi:MAG: cell division protein FtsZ, partial [Thiopseudomonas sp.]|nr:cell division protein FtsZ [Thiopseudomonas sp.]